MSDLTVALDEIRERWASTDGPFQERWLRAQQDVPRLLAALDEVLKDHAPDFDSPSWCAGCGFSYPCSTVRIISRALLMPIRSAG